MNYSEQPVAMKSLNRICLCSLIIFMFSSIWTSGSIQDDVRTRERKVISDIPVPDGYTRLVYPNNSFSKWIQSMSVKNNRDILRHDSILVRIDNDAIYAVVDMPILFNSNLEQCADYCMRFWAEYHKSMNMLDKLYLFNYQGDPVFFRNSNLTYRKFLSRAFAYSNSYSLKKGCKPVTAEDLIPGDMIVQNERGGVGHVSMIMDICESKDKGKLYLIGYSFMPAQEFHVEKAKNRYGIGGWFTLEGYYHFLSDFMNFGKPALRRFTYYLND